MSSASVATSQELCFPLNDAIGIFKTLKECDLDKRELQLQREQNQIKDQRIVNLEKELELAKQELVLKDNTLALKDKIIDLKDQEIAIVNRANDKLKEITDRAMKLAEISKPPITIGNWQLLGLLGIAAYAIGWMSGH